MSRFLAAQANSGTNASEETELSIIKARLSALETRSNETLTIHHELESLKHRVANIETRSDETREANMKLERAVESIRTTIAGVQADLASWNAHKHNAAARVYNKRLHDDEPIRALRNPRTDKEIDNFPVCKGVIGLISDVRVQELLFVLQGPIERFGLTSTLHERLLALVQGESV
ncbi:hypothetical protein EK21DRAFT_112722 [Setomelanomma holmii]|uniref:Uncharacterized protein n=1 Tax=Setomelanomma holmii TaxID=210430 RepID=A0A9P4H9I6_9PLEO|nr:hypothetical protein EK21DRAFT_112722 [Setomelanomma holmii]